ncbi:putative membrane protein YeiH [Hoeflea marina]|uniref:Putative membrane protein YeiH n=1 Tax=Hoeflea marina TaxID=274592 RepID=A0A317PI18_9HYPH|nr:trimeric intracellular cation channel family protein [Hoeflea marina]PWW00093.1 putative membrane protein YeiH [Hoeflea marina]
MPVLEWLDYAGVAVFAATGALAASRKQLDMIGFIFLAAVTGIGGGTVRDLVLGEAPVFWVRNPNYLLITAAVAICVYFTAHLFESRYRLLLWLDATGLAAYSVMGAAKGLAASGSPTVAIVTGMLTATLGGILRDVLSGEPSVLMRPEVYVTAALVGAGAFVAATFAGLPLVAASGIGVLAAFIVRGGALRFGWAFSPYRSRPGRRPEDIM